MNRLFNYMNFSLPSETTMQKCIDMSFENEIKRLQEYINNKKIFLVVDETSNNGIFYTNVLVGLIKNPSKTFILVVDVSQNSPNGEYIFNLILNTIEKNNIKKKIFILLLSDAAKYMKLAAKKLKLEFLHLFHATCIAHLYHNITTILSSYYKEVNSLISSVKAATIKCKKRQHFFDSIGQPRSVIETRWGSWLNSAKYFSLNFIEIKKIVEKFQNDGIIVENCKIAIKSTNLKHQLLELELNYFFLIDLIKKSESINYTIEMAIKDLEEIEIQNDTCNILNYVKKRMENSDIYAIKNMSKENVSPNIYAKLFKCQATSISVERSFSILNKINCKDRNFSDKNIGKYIILHYNLLELNK